LGTIMFFETTVRIASRKSSLPGCISEVQERQFGGKTSLRKSGAGEILFRNRPT